MQGRKAIYLWTYKNLYPIDPISSAPPPFKSIASLVKFVGDGFNGLSGYFKILHMLKYFRRAMFMTQIPL